MFYLQISSQLAKELYLPILLQKWKKNQVNYMCTCTL